MSTDYLEEQQCNYMAGYIKRSPATLRGFDVLDIIVFSRCLKFVYHFFVKWQFPGNVTIKGNQHSINLWDTIDLKIAEFYIADCGAKDKWIGCANILL